MTETEPPDPDPSSAPSQADFPDAAANRAWSLAITLITLWRGANDQDRRTAVAQMLAAIAAEGGPAAVEQAALGLTDVAGMLVELYADHMDASPDQVLQEAATLMADMGPWG
jgi:predicted outer membrane protein